jgi:hypothetical protein
MKISKTKKRIKIRVYKMTRKFLLLELKLPQKIVKGGEPKFIAISSKLIRPVEFQLSDMLFSIRLIVLKCNYCIMLKTSSACHVCVGCIADVSEIMPPSSKQRWT